LGNERGIKTLVNTGKSPRKAEPERFTPLSPKTGHGYNCTFAYLKVKQVKIIFATESTEEHGKKQKAKTL
jgi:hypothetical protein